MRIETQSDYERGEYSEGERDKHFNIRETISKVYQSQAVNNQPLLVLTNIFEVLDSTNKKLKNQYEMQQNQFQKQLQKKILESSRYPRNSLIHNPSLVYPLNKQGSFSLLERSCKIVDNGIQQRQGTKQPVIKTILGFSNDIQMDNQNKKQKLQWIKNKTQYPYRIIVKDNKNKSKAVYFKTQQQADKLRIHFINKFSYQGNLKSLLQSTKTILKQRVIQQFNKQIIACHNKNISQHNQNKQQLVDSNGNSINLSCETDKKIINGGFHSKIDKNMMRVVGNNNQMHQQSYSQKNFPLHQTNSLEYSPNQTYDNKIKQNPLIEYSNPTNRTVYQTQLIKQVNDKQQQKRLFKSTLQQQVEQKKKNFEFENIYVKNFGNQRLQKCHEKEEDNQQNCQDEQIVPKTQNFQNNNGKKITTSKFQCSYKNSKRSLIQNKQGRVTFKSIEFMRQNELFIKPFVTMTFLMGNKIENQLSFNTIIQKKQPYLSYQLIPVTEPTQQLSYVLNKYDINIHIVDTLTNKQMLNEKIKLKNKFFSHQSLISNQAKTIRFSFIYDADNQNIKDSLKIQDNAEGCILEILPINEETTQQIRNYWSKQAMKKSYYNQNKDIKIVDICQLFVLPPKSWALGLSQLQYDIVNRLNIVSKILKFKLTQSVLPIIKVCSKLFTEKNQLIQSMISIIVNYLKPYYFISELNKTNKLHKILGIEDEIQLTSKISLEMQIIKKMIKLECPMFDQNAKKKNIGYIHLLYQYIYEIFSKNFHIRILVDIWNCIFKEPSIIPIYLVLLSVCLVKSYFEKLITCNCLRQVQNILESCEISTVDFVLLEMKKMRQKYFIIPNNNLMDSIKDMFNVKPLQQVITEFYKRQNQRLDYRKQHHIVEKNSILQQLNNEVRIQLPKYAAHSYCLHIYFYKLPQIAGSFSIKTNNTQYSCLSIETNRYFIIPQVNSQITIQFMINKSQIYTSTLQCMQGINKYNIELKSPKNKQVYQIQYICGLLTNGHIEVLKKNKKFQHYLGSFINKQQMYDEFLRSINQCVFLNSAYRKLDKSDHTKKIKSTFNNGNKNFQEIQFYLRWIAISSYTIPEKIKFIKQYANNISNQYFLSDNKQLQKIFLYQFLTIINFHISPNEFKSYYSYSNDNDFQAPKIIKCRLLLPNSIQYKLQHIAHKYQCTKIGTHLYQDIIINQLLAQIQKQLQTQLSNINEATLNILYFHFGKIKNICIPIIKKKNWKDLVIDESKFQYKTNEKNDVSLAEPEILMTETLPTFAKLTTILDFVHSNKSLQYKCKFKQSSKNKITQHINLLKYCDTKYNKVIIMRYRSYPNQIKIPFFNYFHQLIYTELEPQFPKQFYLNNIQTDLKSICVHNGKLNFFDNKGIQATPVTTEIGLYGNLRLLPPKTQSLYFVTIFAQQQIKPNALFFVNYGYGIYQWQPCYVINYSYNHKDKLGMMKQSQKKQQKHYLIKHKHKQRYCKKHQLKIDPKVQERLEEVDEFKYSKDASGDLTKKKMGNSKYRLQ